MRLFARSLIAAILLTTLPLASSPATSDPACRSRLLVLSAFPGEIDRLLTSADITETQIVDGRTFFVGTLAGNDVILVLSGIGLVNAERTTRAALDDLRCGGYIDGIVFSGVSGGPHIGDVMIPESWTLDGPTRHPVDAQMLSVAADAAAGVVLDRATPVGDLPCVGIDPDVARTVEVEFQPQVLVGGVGGSSDGFGGRAFPCIPGGGDVFGCEPCRSPNRAAPDPQRFATDALPFIDPAFFFGYFQAGSPSGTVAQDMETAAVAAVAAERGVPFIAFRAASDGEGDPLGLPGFPFQFFFYRQLAADNAAAVTLAFLGAWATR